VQRERGVVCVYVGGERGCGEKGVGRAAERGEVCVEGRGEGQYGCMRRNACALKVRGCMCVCYVHISLCMQECKHVHVYIHLYMHGYVHGRIHAYIHAYIYSCIHICIHTYMQIYVRI